MKFVGYTYSIPDPLEQHDPCCRKEEDDLEAKGHNPDLGLESGVFKSDKENIIFQNDKRSKDRQSGIKSLVHKIERNTQGHENDLQENHVVEIDDGDCNVFVPTETTIRQGTIQANKMKTVQEPEDPARCSISKRRKTDTSTDKTPVIGEQEDVRKAKSKRIQVCPITSKQVSSRNSVSIKERRTATDAGDDEKLQPQKKKKLILALQSFGAFLHFVQTVGCSTANIYRYVPELLRISGPSKVRFTSTVD
jgi:hypothetical protein